MSFEMARFNRPRFDKDSLIASELWTLEKKISEIQKSGKVPDHYVWYIRNQVYLRRIHHRKLSYHLFKMLMDRLLAALLIAALSPILLVVSAAILILNGRPIFYSDLRLGKFGLPFAQVKFRTLAKDHSTSSDYTNVNVECPNRFMAFLRNHKVDELPQLFNVLFGQMSFIGPRPVPLDQMDFLMEDKLSIFRLCVKPGLSGLWQVTCSKQIAGRRRLIRDAVYIENRSFWLDMRIFFLTFVTVFKGEKKILREEKRLAQPFREERKAA